MMNTPQSWRRLLLGSATSLIFLPWTLSADDAAPTPAPKMERRIEVIRAEAAPRLEKEMRWVVQQGDDHDEMDTELVTFLGVETVRVSPTLTEQLGLDRGIGLVVQRVIEETAAAEALKKHDIITKLDDQLIVSPDQLGVLVRAKDAGTAVTLTFVRAGKVQTAEVTLQARKPDRAHVLHIDRAHEDHTMILPEGGPVRLGMLHGKLAGDIDRADVDHLLAKFKNKNPSEFTWVSKDVWPGPRPCSRADSGPPPSPNFGGSFARSEHQRADEPIVINDADVVTGFRVQPLEGVVRGRGLRTSVIRTRKPAQTSEPLRRAAPRSFSFFAWRTVHGEPCMEDRRPYPGCGVGVRLASVDEREPTCFSRPSLPMPSEVTTTIASHHQRLPVDGATASARPWS